MKKFLAMVAAVVALAVTTGHAQAFGHRCQGGCGGTGWKPGALIHKVVEKVESKHKKSGGCGTACSGGCSSCAKSADGVQECPGGVCPPQQASFTPVRSTIAVIGNATGVVIHSAVAPVNNVTSNLLNAINRARTARGLQPLAHSESLSSTATKNAEIVGSTAPNSNGGPIWHPGNDGPEIIARNQSTPEEAVKSWTRSKGHAAWLYSPNVRTVGVGYSAGRGAPVWAAQFGN